MGVETADDAAVFRLDDTTALVQTVDVITPIVDDPYDFGRIAACNAVSDVYAMGGRPITALNICCFPREGIPQSALRAILEGAADIAAQCGCLIVGGHTIADPELKFGMAVTGIADPARILRNSGAQPDDLLVLTKPVGLGVVMNAARHGLADPGLVAQAVAYMTTLNREGAAAALRHGAHAATDITGFGLLGHALGMAKASGADLRLVAGDIPIIAGAADLHRSGVAVSQCAPNRAWMNDRLDIAEGVDAALVDLLLDPQTSGGLLIALPEPRAHALLADLKSGLYANAAIIGAVAVSAAPRLAILA